MWSRTEHLNKWCFVYKGPRVRFRGSWVRGKKSERVWESEGQLGPLGPNGSPGPGSTSELVDYMGFVDTLCERQVLRRYRVPLHLPDKG